MARRVLLPAAALDSAMHHLRPHFRQNAPAVENQHLSSTHASSSAMTLEQQPVLGADHGELGGTEEFCEAVEQAY